jgi:dTDP-4-dehydrorhamnose reductase
VGVLDRVVVIGASGQLGTDVLAAFGDVRAAAVEHKFVDVENADAVRAMFARYRPTLVINTSAFHQVDLCEVDPAKAFAVNALAVDRLAGLCAVTGATFAHVSTDYVFDGASTVPYDETDATRPLNIYGISKVAGELAIRRYDAPHYIFRVSGLFGRAGTSNKGVTFVERMLRMAEARQPIKVVDDIVFSPSYTVDVARAMRAIVESETYGTYHLTNSGQCSWYDVAVEALRAAGLEWEVARSKSDPAGGFARRPPFSVLGHGSLRRNAMPDLRPWQEAVGAYVEARSARLAAG